MVKQEAESDRPVHVEQSVTLVNMVLYCTHVFFIFFGVSNITGSTCFIFYDFYYSPL